MPQVEGTDTPPDTSTPGRSLTDEHREYLTGEGISDAFVDARAASGLLRSVGPGDLLPEGFDWLPAANQPGILFAWPMTHQTMWQLRPDKPPLDRDSGRPKKYLFAPHAAPSFGLIHRSQKGFEDTVVVVEGTKQSLSVAAALTTPLTPETRIIDATVVAIPGVYGWSKGRVIAPGLVDLCRGRKVLVVPDRDARSNRSVYSALEDLQASLGAAASVEFVWLPNLGADNAGIDDLLKAEPEDRRRVMVEDLLLATHPKPAKRRPNEKAGAGSSEFEAWDADGKLRVQDVAEYIIKRHHWILTEESEQMASYRCGVYRIDGKGRQLKADVARLLGNTYTPGHLNAIKDVIEAHIEDQPRLPIYADQHYANFRNCLVDLRTGEMLPHTPKFLSLRRFDLDYDPSAPSDRWVDWGIQQFGEAQFAALEESISQFLDATRTPGKIVFPFGPSRTGKSSVGRVVRRLVGTRYTSAVKLSQLDDGPGGDKFQAAKLYGKIVNIAPDLPAKHIEDLATVKSLTEGEAIPANQKYGPAFDFVPTALMIFCANAVPTTSEMSEAWFDRVVPIAAVRTFIGESDESIEAAILEQLPGVAVRLVRAYGDHLRRADEHRRLKATGIPKSQRPPLWLPLPDAVWDRFRGDSDRVARFVSGCCRFIPAGESNLPRVATVGMGTNGPATPAQLHEAFQTWAAQESGGSLGRNKFIGRLRSMPGVDEVRIGPKSIRALSVEVLDPDDWDTDTPSDEYLVKALFGADAVAAPPAPDNLRGVAPVDDPPEADPDEPVEEPAAEAAPVPGDTNLLDRAWALIEARQQPATDGIFTAMSDLESGALSSWDFRDRLAALQAIEPQLTVSEASEVLGVAPEAALPLLRLVAARLAELVTNLVIREVTRVRQPDGSFTVFDPTTYIEPETKKDLRASTQPVDAAFLILTRLTEEPAA